MTTTFLKNEVGEFLGACLYNLHTAVTCNSVCKGKQVLPTEGGRSESLQFRRQNLERA